MSNPLSASSLRDALVAADRASVGRAYPPALRRAVVAYAEVARARGDSIASIAESIGLPSITLQRWSRAAASSPFRAVVVEPAALPAAAPSSSIIIHGPGGLRIEGLDLDSVAELLRRLS